MSDTLHILIIDDHPLFAEGLKTQLQLLSINNQIDLFAKGTEAIKQLDQRNPYKLIVLDLNMPDISGFELLKLLGLKGFTTPCLVISANSDNATAEKAINYGAKGYLCKSSSPDILRDAARKVMQGELFLDPSLPRLATASDSMLPSAQIDNTNSSITPRSLEVLSLIAKGHSNKVIASLLGISEATVKWHVSRLFETLEVKNRTACVNKAARLGLVETTA